MFYVADKGRQGGSWKGYVGVAGKECVECGRCGIKGQLKRDARTLAFSTLVKIFEGCRTSVKIRTDPVELVILASIDFNSSTKPQRYNAISSLLHRERLPDNAKP